MPNGASPFSRTILFRSKPSSIKCASMKSVPFTAISANFISASNSRSTNCSAGYSFNTPAPDPWGEHGHDQDQEHEFKGWVAEWSNAHAWKACLPKGNQGSNPCPSVPLFLFLLVC